MNTEELAKSFGMKVHEENGLFVERHYEHKGPERPASGSIYYFVDKDEKTEFHRIDCDEYWCYNSGSTIELWIIYPDGKLTIRKCGITEGGMACGPVPGNVVVTVQFKEGSTVQWLSLVEFDGIPNVYLSDKDIYEDLMAEDFDDEKFTEYLHEHFIQDFNGIKFEDDYSTTFESIADDPKNPAIPLVRYLIALVRCDMDDVENLIQMASGKYADQLDIPVSDVEEEFMDEQ